ncbi:MAG: multiheme c-type cytochrome [Planctomycetota bacterium]|nr:multiheme c-type cytochrome [Planctomycetota bacterium]
MSTPAATPPSTPPARGAGRAVVGGVLLGAAALLAVFLVQRTEDAEVEQYFARATPAAIASWSEELHRRGAAWADVPDPPGNGPVERAHYWLARDRYDLELRRRGSRLVVRISGVAEHEFGGAWAAFGEGHFNGPESGFAGGQATFVWSCLGLRYRHASDGVGRITFDADGEGCTAIYMAWEAPAIWSKSYGRRHAVGDPAPDYGAIKGQIPISDRLPTLETSAEYRVGVAVVDLAGQPVAGALVQLKGQRESRVLTDASGRAEVAFRGQAAPYAQSFCAGAPGFLNGETPCLTGDIRPGLVPGARAPTDVVIELAPLPLDDDPSYAWQRASAADGPDDAMACGTCHPWHYDQWYESRHARMADHGHVTWEHARMVSMDPSAPDDCVGCHQPAFAATEMARPNPALEWKPRGVSAANHCDLCHKIQALLDPRASGVFGAYALARPGPKNRVRPGGIHHVFGSAPDVTYAYMGASYNPIFATGHVCAGCHQGGGRWRDGSPPKIDTFEEWKRWAAARPAAEVRTCQDCHMPGAVSLAADGRPIDQMAWDAIHRRPQDMHDHRFPGVEPELGEVALRVAITKRRDEATGAWIAEVAVTNVGAGHKVPTGTWSKHVVVGVWAEVDGRPLRQRGGERAELGARAAGDPALAPGDWRDPGGFVLGVRARRVDAEGADVRGLAPPVFWGAWMPEDVIDERLEPGATRRAECVFEPAETEPTIEVRVLHRRGWLPGGLGSVPWTLGTYDPLPEVLWSRVRR